MVFHCLICCVKGSKRNDEIGSEKVPYVNRLTKFGGGVKSSFQKGLSFVQFNCYFSVSSGLHNQHRKLVDVKTEISLLGN